MVRKVFVQDSALSGLGIVPKPCRAGTVPSSCQLVVRGDYFFDYVCFLFKLKLVGQPEYGTNYAYFVDFIQVCLSAKLLNSKEIGRPYLEEKLSLNQIASKFKVSRSAIKSRLWGLGINIDDVKQALTNPENYRYNTPPYGFQIRDGKLLPNRLEMKICRFVIELIEREGRNHSEVARELTRRRLKTRAGKVKWDSKTIFNIFKRWKNKL